MTDANELRALLAQHYGGRDIFKHALVGTFNYTEGVRAFAKNAGGGAYWLLDIMATEPAIRDAVRGEGFCVALLSVNEGRAELTVSRDAEVDPATKLTRPLELHFTRAIDFTDCPDGQWKFYLTYTTVGSKDVILAMLPKEY